MAKKYWLFKSEPNTYSIDDLKKDKKTTWDGVRNYQARNFMRDEMEIGDEVLFYHSNAKPPAVVGLAKVSKKAVPDDTAFDPKEKYYDPKSNPKQPRWFMVEISFVKKLPQPIALPDLKKAKNLSGLLLLKKGQRLSIQPVEARHFQAILKMGAA